MSVGADPGRVIDRMANEIGQKAKEIAIAHDMIQVQETVIQRQEEEIVQLKAQLTEQVK